MANELNDDTGDELAKAFERPLTSGEQLPAPQAGPMQMTFEGAVITAQRVAVPRDDGAVLNKIKALAAAASTDWFYRFPVKDRKTGKSSWIEGPSIKLTNSVARLYGNCAVDCRVIDDGPAFMIYAKFADYESGFSLVRPFRQDKGASRLGGQGPEADARRLDIALQIGVSKAQRNAIANALEIYCDYAFEQAQKSIVTKIAGNIDAYRERARKWFDEHGIAIERVERAYGRSVKEWLATDLARIAAEVQAVADNMSSAADTWPEPIPAEPRRDDRQQHGPADASPTHPPEAGGHGGDTPPTAGDAHTAGRLATETASRPSPLSGGDAVRGQGGQDDGGGVATAGRPASFSPDAAGQPERKNWRVPEGTVGQEAIVKVLDDLIGMAESDAELDALQDQNKERIGKFSANLRSRIARTIADRRLVLQQEQERAGGGGVR